MIYIDDMYTIYGILSKFSSLFGSTYGCFSGWWHYDRLLKLYEFIFALSCTDSDAIVLHDSHSSAPARYLTI